MHTNEVESNTPIVTIDKTPDAQPKGKVVRHSIVRKELSS